MATMQGGIGTAYNIPARSRPRIGPEDPMTVPFPAESRARHQIPDAEPRFRARRSDPNAPMEPSVVWAMLQKRTLLEGARSGPNAPSSSDAGAFDAYRLFHVPEPHWLEEALAELAEVDDEIAEDDLPQVSDTTKAEAERLVRALAWTPLAPSVYPTQDAEIALHFKSPGASGTVVILLSDGGRADCHAYVDGRSRRAHYQTSSDLPDAFVLDQLRRLTPDGTAFSGAGARVLPFPTAFQTNLLSTR